MINYVHFKLVNKKHSKTVELVFRSIEEDNRNRNKTVSKVTLKMTELNRT